MADVELVIRIPEDKFRNIFRTGEVSFCVINAIRFGKILKKGHGRLIDVSDIEWAKFTTESRFYGYDELLHWEDIENAPTIIPADPQMRGTGGK